MIKLLRNLLVKKPKHDLFEAGDQVKFSQRKGRQVMKQIQRKGRG